MADLETTTKVPVIANSFLEMAVLTALVVLDVIIILGNFLILAAFFSSTKLRTVTNCFILSLALADFLVGMCVLPPAIMLRITDGVWLLGWVLCDAWISLDVLLCTASILSLCAISIDRYLAISQPIKYSKVRRSKKLAGKIIIGVWILSVLITCPPMLGWSEPQRHGPDYEECRYNENVGYVIFSACGSFYLPLCVIVYTYAKIICVVVKSNVDLKEGRRHCAGQATTSHGIQVTRDGKRYKMSNAESPKRFSCKSRSSSSFLLGKPKDSGAERAARGSDGSQSRPTNILERENIKLHYLDLTKVSGKRHSKNLQLCPCCGQANSSLLHVSYVESPNQLAGKVNTTLMRSHETESLKPVFGDLWRRQLHFRETRTAKRLAIVVSLFITCWLPFFVLYVCVPFINKSDFPEDLYSFSTWLGWFNSAINPFIYASYSPTFRKPFFNLTGRRMLTCWTRLKERRYC